MYEHVWVCPCACLCLRDLLISIPDVFWRDESMPCAYFLCSLTFYLCGLYSLSVNGESMERHVGKCVRHSCTALLEMSITLQHNELKLINLTFPISLT